MLLHVFETPGEKKHFFSRLDMMAITQYVVTENRKHCCGKKEKKNTKDLISLNMLE